MALNPFFRPRVGLPKGLPEQNLAFLNTSRQKQHSGHTVIQPPAKEESAMQTEIVASAVGALKLYQGIKYISCYVLSLI